MTPEENINGIDVKDAKEVTLTQEEVIQAKVAELKNRPDINEVIVLQAGEKVGYMKPPSRDQLKYATTISQGNQLELAEAVITAGWIEGDEALLKEDKYFLTIAAQIDTIIETETVNIKKY